MDIDVNAVLDDQLREWARGSYPEEAAVELLIRTGWTRRGSFRADVVQHSEAFGRQYLDWDALGQILRGERDSGILAASGGELRVLRIAYSLAGNGLSNTIPGLDRNVMSLVLAAMAHANGSHEQNGPPTPDPAGRFTMDVDGEPTRVSFPRLGSLYPWPEQA